MPPDDRPPLRVVADDEAGRAQDQGRRHRKAGRPSPETSTLLAQYQEAMRDELRATLDDIRGQLPDHGLGLDDGAVKRPPIAERTRLWDLAIKLGRELGTEVDPAGGVGGGPDNAAPPAKRRRRRVDFGPDA